MSAPKLLFRPFSMSRSFLATEAAGGMLLIAAAGFAMIVANSGLSGQYLNTLHAQIGVLSLLDWINDGWMALFFLVVGLEIKRELLVGRLSLWSERLLPGVAAIAGVLAPALIYLVANYENGAGLRGWAIPAATDIAFAVGILALLGPRVPVSLKIFLTAVAIIDDLIAVLIIALFYTSRLDLVSIACAGMGLAILTLFNRRGISVLWPYLLVGFVVWVFVLRSGIHAALAGAAVAMTIPLGRTPGKPAVADAPLVHLERRLHPWVALVIVPVFAFANAGLSLRGLAARDILHPVPLGIALGLFLGKQIGIFGTIWCSVKFGWAGRPHGASWPQVYGIALLCGIGFTMSLFITGLAFGDGSQQADASKLGILLGSIAAAIMGFIVLRIAPAKRNQHA